ncbi:MAG: hypothetical protein ACXWG1_12935 [Usitatibacter sp.]
MSIPQFQSHGHDSHGTVTWQGRLEAAEEEREIVSIAREFLAQFTPEEIHRLPVQCRPRKLMDANDVTSYAFELVRHECGDDADTLALVHKLASFFSEASIRLSQLLGHQDGDSQRSA